MVRRIIFASINGCNAGEYYGNPEYTFVLEDGYVPKDVLVAKI